MYLDSKYLTLSSKLFIFSAILGYIFFHIRISSSLDKVCNFSFFAAQPEMSATLS